ncbi:MULTISPECIES: 1,2-phenylacetyl-CoA epoxidase subunit PaaD [unclassified Mesobacillus]|uniref:1,2-phenylacetyl-CoA epoxidase subunit PaaD n=1 Tax=unclassified Mesobacillus TaxID=2675270 RepID=UPI00203B6AF7|nr:MULTISPECIES: 1,2-phenylacetyl-CoA epoxidase subunit PaaD [unclassified Mesobacillus]MCM3123193.1 phenylacetate-CoA oxygenase subunit PaaJ [Mesobacillus sp. MER 33]MCM3233324.1 phenylacetate-CoA oxygenase subunit PaaJ [Mesobacillus sp. MER 48]
MLRDKVYEALQTVKDPEIDSVSIIELGMVEELNVLPETVQIKLLPTFMGCPALDIIKNNVVNAVSAIDGVEKVKVEFIFHPPWTSDRVSEIGREKLKEFGIAPPPRHLAETGEWQADCPYCGSTYTTMENLFGPTACRSILYCKSCKNPFEAMKPVSTLM